MGARGPYVDDIESEAPLRELPQVRWLDQEAVLAEFHHGDTALDVFRRALLDDMTGRGGWRAPGGSHRVARRRLLHDEEWDRGGCHG